MGSDGSGARSTAFEEMVRGATGYAPYPYQVRMAGEGLPDLLRAPTGAGKTLAATLPWLYRRRFHPDAAVRSGTPRWLVLVLPQRALVEQTLSSVRGWLAALGLSDVVGLHVLMGGGSSDDRLWKMRPADDAVFVGTQDMVLSRLLLRGYAEPRAAWPIAFGFLNSGAQFVFDEVQLMGPALPTSLQLEGLRAALGTALPSQSMWMSATVDPAALRSADYAGPARTVELGPEDRHGALRRRLLAARVITRGEVADDPARYESSVAALVAREHHPGTRTIVVVNTVERATNVYVALHGARLDADVVLLHSRFRPGDRSALMDRTLAAPPAAGSIVVATQVLEAGIDISSRLLVTEVAPWSSLVQRAGRCNRAGEYETATLVWVSPPPMKGWAAPYAEQDLRAAREALQGLGGVAITGTDLQDFDVGQVRPLHPVLRRRDLVDLFDTQPDLAGNDLDVSRWIRDSDETSAAVAWRHVREGVPEPADVFPGRDELCAVPLGQLREFVRHEHVRDGGVFVYDQTVGGWRRATGEDVRPGVVLVLDRAVGGYLPDHGWSPRSRLPVQVVEGVGEPLDAVGSDPLSLRQGRWVPLAEHLEDVRAETVRLLAEFGGLPGLTGAHQDAAARAGLLHDLGKAHPVFADTLRRSAGEGAQPPGDGPWAKSPGARRARHRRRYFRHELVSALVVLDLATELLDGLDDPELAAYLVGAHHGKVRVSVRSMPGEQDSVLGVQADDEPIAAIRLPGGQVVPATRPRLGRLALGAADGQPSWQAMACRLRDRDDLGVFRLAFLEAAVRAADWRASATYDEPAAGAG